MILWETEFFAVSVLSGEIESYRGVFIQAPSIQEAFKIARVTKLDYLQFTGKSFPDMEAVMRDEEFYDKLDSLKEEIKSMDFDAFYDWLDLANSLEDLINAKNEFEGVAGMEEHVKIIEMYINKYGKKKDSNKEEGE